MKEWWNYKMKFVKRKPNVYKANTIWTNDYILNQEKRKKFLDTAVTSWNGFVYQGKVAIYYVLQEISNCNYELQLDSIEDFSIINSINRSIISMHQVKAKKSDDFSQYKNAFEKLMDKANFASCQNVYFHLANGISNKPIDDIQALYPPMTIYMYDGLSYCPVDEIDQKIEGAISALMLSRFPDDSSKSSPEYAKKTRRFLDDIITKQLSKIHAIIHANLLNERTAAYTQTIPFSEFINILDLDLNQQELGDEYYFYLIVEDFYRYFQEYCIEYETDLSKEDRKRLNSIIIKFKDFNKYQMTTFFQNITPHRTFNFKTICDYKQNSIDADEIKDTFFYILHQLKNDPHITDKFLLHWVKNINPDETKFYSPTTIDKPQSQLSKVSERIIKNAFDNDLNVMFESDYLITNDMTGPIHIPAIKKENENNHIMKWKNVSLISINQAKEDLDD
ncbi:MAG: hypothetical protein PHW18_06635 [Sulfuricurvum sp.]|uniref:ABC-three component system protein n=1 Tax=Sulfuricurvum sp. TaxID=2025608 RepID=UPI002625C521|nr:ABC-three component system protein [Sulfuricurvum sp.]MDD2829234.1 hypothetical protein [Sulfuricurvum sp.]